MAEWMFNQRGDPCLILDGDRIRGRSSHGHVIAWINDSNVHSLTGVHVGWFEGGVIYDSSNCALAFLRAHASLPGTPGLTGTPAMPGFPAVPRRPGLAGCLRKARAWWLVTL